MIVALVKRLFGRPETHHRAIDDLVAELSPYGPLRGSRWRHRKGGEYRVDLVVYRESTLEKEVIYTSVADTVSYSRPLVDFMDGRFTRMPDETNP